MGITRKNILYVAVLAIISVMAFWSGWNWQPVEDKKIPLGLAVVQQIILRENMAVLKITTEIVTSLESVKGFAVGDTIIFAAEQTPKRGR